MISADYQIVIPAVYFVIPAISSVILSVYFVIPAVSFVIPAKAGIQSGYRLARTELSAHVKSTREGSGC